MPFDQGGSVQPGVVDAWRFTRSPDSLFPPYRSLQGSFATDSHSLRSSSSDSLTPSDAIEYRDNCRAYSIEYYFPPDYSEAGSPSAPSSPSTMMSSLGGRAPNKSAQKEVDVLDTLGSRLTELENHNGFFSSLSLKGNIASTLELEATKAVTEVATLLKSLSEEMEIFSSVVVRTLIVDYKEELLIFSDKREELNRLSGKVVRLGKLCNDPQWRLLDIYFAHLESSNSQNNIPKGGAELERDYIQKLHEVEALNLSGKGEIKLLLSKLKIQRKSVRSLKKKSLWSRDLDEIMEFLVDAVSCIHQLFVDVFGNEASKGTGENLKGGSESLGEDGLAFRYANIVLQINSIASDLPSLSSKARDSLYDALPESVKKALRSRLQNHGAEEEHLSASEIKAEMEKTLEWLVPLAKNTPIPLENYNWFGKSPVTSLTRFQTLIHAKEHKMDSCILELVTLLHKLVISSSRNQDGTRKIWPWQSNAKTILDNHPISKTQVSPSANHDDNDPEPGNTNLSTQNRMLSEQQTTVRNKSSLVEASLSY